MSEDAFLDKLFPRTFMVVNVQVGDEDAYALRDENGFLYKKDEVMEIFENAKKFYEVDGVDEFIKNENKKQSLNLHLNRSNIAGTDEQGRTILSLPEADMRQFNRNKNHWSFKCALCSEKVSSRERDHYYVQNTDIGFFLSLPKTSHMVCSKECGKVVAKEDIREWMHEEGYQDHLIIE